MLGLVEILTGLLAVAMQVNGTGVVPIIVQTNEGQPDLIDTLLGAFLAIASAIAVILKWREEYQKGRAAIISKEKQEIANDRDVQNDALKDALTFASKVYAANADGKVTPEEFNVLAEEGRLMAAKYGDKFGIDVGAVLAQLKSLAPPPTTFKPD